MQETNRPLTVLLIRHAESVTPGTSGFDEYTRPLTPKGIRDAHRLSETHTSTRIDAVYSSPYIRARQTIEPIARARGLAIETIDDLRERTLSLADLPDWQAHLKRSWEDFDYAVAGGESSHDAQARILRVLDTIASRHSTGTVILASHGNLIALALHAFMPNVNYEFWESIPTPAVFTLIRDGNRWTVALPR
jgi:2,3-bisphosphoglycerate-dependent phosphoglycerate mutase